MFHMGFFATVGIRVPWKAQHRAYGWVQFLRLATWWQWFTTFSPPVLELGAAWYFPSFFLLPCALSLCVWCVLCVYLGCISS